MALINGVIRKSLNICRVCIKKVCNKCERPGENCEQTTILLHLKA